MATIIEELHAIANNFAKRRHDLQTHHRTTHTANIDQRKAMVIQINVWEAAEAYVRARAATLESEQAVWICPVSSMPCCHACIAICALAPLQSPIKQGNAP